MTVVHQSFVIMPNIKSRAALRSLWIVFMLASSAAADEPCRIEVIEKDSGWPVPMVELRTTGNVLFVTDNAGIVAIDAPDLLNREVWFSVDGNGYEVPADGFGYRGVRLTPRAGETLQIKVERRIIARRIGRLTGGGLFAHSQRLGGDTDWAESGIVGCDSVQNAVYRGRHFWLWGDTTLPNYPLGIFDGSSATTALEPIKKPAPPLKVKLDYFTDKQGQPRGVADMPGDGPTWLTGYIALPDAAGEERLVATYSKIKPPLEAYERGLCVWNDTTETFEHLKTIWNKSTDQPTTPPIPMGHPVLWNDESGAEWVLFGDPFPTLRCPASFEAWQDSSQWRTLKPQATLESATGEQIRPHTGSIAYREFRGRWVTVFMQRLGKPSPFGELWYAEADAPTGPWGTCVKVLSHKNYTFYNPRLHPEFTPTDSPVLLFEGTYTRTFANNPEPTPRYDYNQILYRLDLDDPALAAAQQ